MAKDDSSARSSIGSFRRLLGAYRRLRDLAGVMLSPLYLLVGYGVARLFAVTTASAVVGAVLLLIAALPIATSRFTLKGRQAVRSSGVEDWGGTVALGFVLLGSATAGFALLNVALFAAGLRSVHGGHVHGVGVINTAYSSQIWYLAKAVPLLDIPETLHWSLHQYFTSWGQGAVVLAYKAVVIGPVLYIGGQLFGQLVQDRPDVEPSPASRSVPRGRKLCRGRDICLAGPDELVAPAT